MRLVEYIILLLQTHAECLNRLSEALGENVLVEVLENVEEQASLPRLKAIHSLDIGESDLEPGTPYGEISEAVESMRLAKRLEFYVWAYPPYRSLIEAPLNLDSKLRAKGPDSCQALADEALALADEWRKSLNLPPKIESSLNPLMTSPWIRFRTVVIAEVGGNPLQAVEQPSQ